MTSDGPQVLSPGSDGWTLSSERALLETTLHQRSGLLVVFAALVGAGHVATRSDALGAVLLCLGAVLGFLVQVSLFRTQAELDAVVGRLRQDPAHPVAWVAGAVGHATARSRLALEGRVVPAVVTTALALAALADLLLLALR